MKTVMKSYFEDDDETEVYKIVTTIRGNSLDGRISNESPLGSALMKHKVGDRVFIQTEGNNGYYVVIKAIENTGEAETDKIRSF